MQIEENVGGPFKSSETVVLNHSLNLEKRLWSDIEIGSNLLCPYTDIFNRIREPFSS